MPKIWVDRTTLNGEEKEDGLKAITLASHDHKDLVQTVVDQKSWFVWKEQDINRFQA